MNQTALVSIFRRIKRNFWAVPHLHVAATGTIAFSLLIAGVFLVLYTNVNDLIAVWKKDFRIIAYVNEDVSAGQGKALRDTVSRMEEIQTVTYVSQEEALHQLRKQMKHRSSLLEGLQTNPLPASLEIELVHTDPDEGRIGNVVRALEGLPEIESVEYARAWLRRFTGFVTFFRLATLVIGAVIFATTVFICSNTIRLTLYARREELAVMQIIGATDAFIKAPYYLQNIVEGLLGSAIALGILFGAYYLLTAQLAAQQVLLSAGNMRFLSGWEIIALLLSGIIMAWLGCYLSLKQFTKS